MEHRDTYPKVKLPPGVRITTKKPAGADCYYAVIWRNGEHVESIQTHQGHDWWYHPAEARYYGGLRALELFAPGTKPPDGPPDAPAARRSAPKRRPGSWTQARVIRALRQLEAHWPDDLWLYVETSTGLHLMQKENGERVALPDGACDPAAKVRTFYGIETDAGEWQ